MGEVIPYCSATGTREIREKLLGAGWSCLWVATGHNWNSLPVMPYAIDNGAWSAHLRGVDFDSEAFGQVLRFSEKFTDDVGLAPGFVVLPDIVAGGVKSLQWSLRWEAAVRPYCDQLLIAVQDGMTPEDVEPYLDENTGLFLGGTTTFKLQTMEAWGQLAKAKRCYFHVGRVNSVKRITACSINHANSFDGTSVCRFPETLSLLNKARKQLALPF